MDKMDADGKFSDRRLLSRYAPAALIGAPAKSGDGDGEEGVEESDRRPPPLLPPPLQAEPMRLSTTFSTMSDAGVSDRLEEQAVSVANGDPCGVAAV